MHSRSCIGKCGDACAESLCIKMSSRTPIVKQISWLATIPQLLALLFAMAVGGAFRPRDGIFWGAAVYLVYSIGSRQLVPRHHRAGVALVKQQRFEEAIPKFQESLRFFDRYSWIDRFRSVVLMSPSAAGYREMALANIAFCYGQMGEGRQSRHYYEKCLERFPDSGLAKAAIRMLDAAQQSRGA